MYEDGTPFFWLGDTAWQMFHRHTEAGALTFMRDRAMKGFNVIQAVCLAEHGGLTSPNANGEMAFIDKDFTVPNDRYFDHIERLVDMADSLGMFMGLLPTWGDKFNLKWGPGPVIFDTPEKAENYGKYIGRRFGDKRNVIFIMGGDRPADSEGVIAVIRAMARGIAVGTSGSEDYSKVLMTYHPWGQSSTTEWFDDEPWIDFNMQQNGHKYDVPLWDRIAKDYNRTPAKPVLDGEPLYDEHSIDFKLENGVSTDYHCRRFFYHEVFSGACGHTFGSTGVWQVYDPAERPKIGDVFTRWEESLGRAASYQMGYGKELVMSRPFFTRVPDQTLVENALDGHDRITAMRDSLGRWAMVYSERGRPFRVHIECIGGGEGVDCWWFDPRSGHAIPLERPYRRPGWGDGWKEFVPPTSGAGNDWVLVIDDPRMGYPTPGRIR
jgi:hypothetical protein